MSTVRKTAIAALVLGVALLGGCSSDDDAKVTTTTSATKSTPPEPDLSEATDAMARVSDHLETISDRLPYVTSHGTGFGTDAVEVTIGVNETTAAAAKAHCAELKKDVESVLDGFPYKLTIESWVQSDDGTFAEGDWPSFDC